MVRRRSVASVLVACVVLAGSLGSAACAAVFGFERLSEEVPPVEAGVPDAATEGGEPPVEGGASCTSLGIAERPGPNANADAGAGPGPVHVAVKLLDFGIERSAAAVGFNLDRTCSSTVATSSCATTIDEATFDKYGKDKNETGLDNAGFALLGYLAQLGSAFAPASINERLADGEFGAVMRLSNWNGTNEDDDVLVEVFPSIGVWTPVDGGVPVAGGKPAFTASDLWRRDSRFQNVVDASRIKSAGAWVTGGRLVASFQSITIALSVPDDPKPLDVTVQEGYVSGALVADGASFRLAGGVLGGRWRTADILGQSRTIYVKDTAGLQNVVLCDPGAPTIVYGAIKKEVCDSRDLRSSSREDGQGLSCDSFSVGIKFETYAVAEAGPFDDLPVLPARCEKAGSVPVADDCPPAAP
jgi:hypothetical protein